jgi:hypothetical protein
MHLSPGTITKIGEKAERSRRRARCAVSYLKLRRLHASKRFRSTLKQWTAAGYPASISLPVTPRFLQRKINIRDHSQAKFSHGICPEGIKKLYPKLYLRLGRRFVSQAAASIRLESSIFCCSPPNRLEIDLPGQASR